MARVGRFRPRVLSNVTGSFSSEQQLVNCDTVDSACYSYSWITASLSLSMTRARRPVTCTSQSRALARPRVAPWIVQGSVADYKVVFTDSAHVLMSTVAQLPCPSPLRQTSARFNRTRLVC